MKEAYWEIPDYIDENSFDFEWSPDKNEPPYIHQFGTSQDKGNGPRLVIPGAIDLKYHDEPIAKHKNETAVWEIPGDLVVTTFDFSWRPSVYEPLYHHQWGTTADPHCGPKLIVEGAVETKYYVEKSLSWRPLDIVFVSNGEQGEQERYDRLRRIAGRPVEWVRGIAGRENALRQAAKISKTDWFILFPGKLSADAKFDYNFQPNRSREPKHYIFYAQNPLNGLKYGHQAAVCYNRKLVLETIDYGLDFTMSKLHEVVPILSGTAEYNSTVIMTWRTAFREAIKLKANGGEESLERLEVWLTTSKGKHCEWSIIGAHDGLHYYECVNGDHRELMKSFSWSWLDEYFISRYQNVIA